MMVTLQISLSAGDAAYAHLTVPALLKAHAALKPHRLVVLDAIEPFWPEGARGFHGRLEVMRRLVAGWSADKMIDEVYELKADDPVLSTLVRKYLRPVRMTHGVGTPLSSYALPLELIKSGFWLHYDGDMLLHQRPGYDWTTDAASLLMNDSRAIAASPRVSPPFTEVGSDYDRPSRVDGGARVERLADHWRVYWFSTRCFLVDVGRFRQLAPYVRARYLPEVMLRKALSRGYPPSFEIMVHNSFTKPEKLHRLDLLSASAFTLHPDNKGERFNRMLPEIISSVEAGLVPAEQEGWENLDLSAWERFLGEA